MYPWPSIFVFFVVSFSPFLLLIHPCGTVTQAVVLLDKDPNKILRAMEWQDPNRILGGNWEDPDQDPGRILGGS